MNFIFILFKISLILAKELKFRILIVKFVLQNDFKLLLKQFRLSFNNFKLNQGVKHEF